MVIDPDKVSAALSRANLNKQPTEQTWPISMFQMAFQTAASVLIKS